MKTHINKTYENELLLLQNKIIFMAQRVKKNIQNSIKSIYEDNLEMALSVIEYDNYIDKEELIIDELCIEIIAKRQPLGRDLRLVVSVLKMVTYLERLGDLAVNIAERVKKLKGTQKNLPIENIKSMGELVEEMLSNTIQAFMDKDAKKALFVIKSDNAMDDLYYDTMGFFVQKIKDEKLNTQEIFHILSIAKWLERMGDHCANLAELIIFMVKGEDVRHASMGKKETLSA